MQRKDTSVHQDTLKSGKGKPWRDRVYNLATYAKRPQSEAQCAVLAFGSLDRPNCELLLSMDQAQFLLIPEWRIWHHSLKLELLKEAH